MRKMSRKSAETLLGIVGTLTVLELGEIEDFIEIMCDLEIQLKALDVDFLTQLGIY
jgi:hypothetical protein